MPFSAGGYPKITARAKGGGLIAYRGLMHTERQAFPAEKHTCIIRYSFKHSGIIIGDFGS